MDAHALKGMAIVSLQEGTKLGQIAQPLFDMATRQLGGLNIFGTADSFVVPFDQIHIRSSGLLARPHLGRYGSIAARQPGQPTTIRSASSATGPSVWSRQ